MSSQPRFKIAIVRNYDTLAQWGKDMVESWKTLLNSLCSCEVEVFHPITDDTFPDANQYHLIILTGGLFNLTLPDLEPWVARTMDFIVDTAKNCTGTKIAGICWGHQAICRAMGGVIGWNANGDSVGVQTTLEYTPEGCKFFRSTTKDAPSKISTSFALHKFHKRQISTLPPGFIDLAADHEIILSTDNRIIGFQGHPEMTQLVAEGILRADGGAYTGLVSEQRVADMYESFKRQHDGVEIFKRVIQWLQE